MDEKQAAADVEKMLRGEESRQLGASQVLLLQMASNEQGRYREQAAAMRQQAEALESQGDAVMNTAVVSIRKDFAIPDGVKIEFKNGTAGVVVAWLNPAPSKPELVKDDPQGDETPQA